MQTDTNCYGQQFGPYSAGAPFFASDDTSVCDADFGGQATGVGPGQTAIRAGWAADRWFAVVEVEDPVLGLDELWSFVLREAGKRWIRVALCRQTRQVVAFVIGDRSEKTCRRLWGGIPEGFRHAQCSTDFWTAYAKVLPAAQHTAVGKESGETAHVERRNLTLRQRLARFVRQTLSFSKSEKMHESCLRLFIHRYNNSQALTLL